MRVARILSAAARLIEKRGLAEVNTNAVAKTARLPVGTLYQFFPNREAVLQALLREQLSKFNAHLFPLLAPSHDDEPLDAQIETIVDALAAAYLKVPALAPLLQAFRGDAKFAPVAMENNAAISEALGALISRRVPNLPRARARAAAVTLVEAADAVLMAWLRTRDGALLIELKRLLRSYAGAVIRT
jgi:AcrR family transcriptional regulator